MTIQTLHKLPTRDQDSFFPIMGYRFPMWQEKDHYMIKIDMKDGSYVVFSGYGTYQPEKHMEITNAFLKTLLDKYSL